MSFNVIPLAASAVLFPSIATAAPAPLQSSEPDDILAPYLEGLTVTDEAFRAQLAALDEAAALVELAVDDTVPTDFTLANIDVFHGGYGATFAAGDMVLMSHVSAPLDVGAFQGADVLGISSLANGGVFPFTLPASAYGSATPPPPGLVSQFTWHGRIGASSEVIGVGCRTDFTQIPMLGLSDPAQYTYLYFVPTSIVPASSATTGARAAEFFARAAGGEFEEPGSLFGWLGLTGVLPEIPLDGPGGGGGMPRMDCGDVYACLGTVYTAHQQAMQDIASDFSAEAALLEGGVAAHTTDPLRDVFCGHGSGVHTGALAGAIAGGLVASIAGAGTNGYWGCINAIIDRASETDPLSPEELEQALEDLKSRYEEIRCARVRATGQAVKACFDRHCPQTAEEAAIIADLWVQIQGC